jgi:hypothetical protein
MQNTSINTLQYSAYYNVVVGLMCADVMLENTFFGSVSNSYQNITKLDIVPNATPIVGVSRALFFPVSPYGYMTGAFVTFNVATPGQRTHYAFSVPSIINNKIMDTGVQNNTVAALQSTLMTSEDSTLLGATFQIDVNTVMLANIGNTGSAKERTNIYFTKPAIQQLLKQQEIVIIRNLRRTAEPIFPTATNKCGMKCDPYKFWQQPNLNMFNILSEYLGTLMKCSDSGVGPVKMSDYQVHLSNRAATYLKTDMVGSTGLTGVTGVVNRFAPNFTEDVGKSGRLPRELGGFKLRVLPNVPSLVSNYSSITSLTPWTYTSPKYNMTTWVMCGWTPYTPLGNVSNPGAPLGNGSFSVSPTCRGYIILRNNSEAPLTPPALLDGDILLIQAINTRTYQGAHTATGGVNSHNFTFKRPRILSSNVGTTTPYGMYVRVSGTISTTAVSVGGFCMIPISNELYAPTRYTGGTAANISNEPNANLTPYVEFGANNVLNFVADTAAYRTSDQALFDSMTQGMNGVYGVAGGWLDKVGVNVVNVPLPIAPSSLDANGVLTGAGVITTPTGATSLGTYPILFNLVVMGSYEDVVAFPREAVHVVTRKLWHGNKISTSLGLEIEETTIPSGGAGDLTSIMAYTRHMYQNDWIQSIPFKTDTATFAFANSISSELVRQLGVLGYSASDLSEEEVLRVLNQGLQEDVAYDKMMWRLENNRNDATTEEKQKIEKLLSLMHECKSLARSKIRCVVDEFEAKVDPKSKPKTV